MNPEQQADGPGKKRIGVLMQACDGEEQIGREALRTLVEALQPHELIVQIMDDASNGLVGNMLAEYCQELGVQASCHRMDKPLGYRGIMTRCFIGFRKLAAIQPALDYVIKTDTDTLYLGKQFGQFVTEQCTQDDGFYGVTHKLRKRDLLLLISDLMPFGFRRKKENGMVQRKWSFSRLLPVWWTGIGYKAMLGHRQFTTIITGGVYVIAGPLMQRFKQLGYLDRDVTKRYGFITSEEDTILSLMTRVCGGKVIDANQVRPNFGEMRLTPGTSVDDILQAGFTVIHPLKRNDYSEQVRKEIRQRNAAQAEPG